MVLESGESASPKPRRLSFGKSLEPPSDASGTWNETLPVHLSMLESPSDESNIMDESLPVFSDLSFNDSSRDETSLASESGQEVSVERSHECAEAEVHDGRTIPPTSPQETESKATPRRSQRHREEPERLQYSQLGNPLLFIAQSLFQGLNVAFADALQSYSYADVPNATPKARLSQSCGCNGTYTPLRGEGVTHVIRP